MPHSPVRLRQAATDGEWMDIHSAAVYAGVTFEAFTEALADGELPTGVAYGLHRAVLVHSHVVETWAAERESRLVGQVG
jgi:hypothetical protein